MVAPYTFGPRHFLHLQNVYEYLDELLPLRELEHEFYSYIEEDKKFYSFPISYEDINTMPDKNKILSELDSLDESRSLII